MNIVIDLGAHYLEGATKLIEDQVIYRDSHIISVEANPYTFSNALAHGVIEKFKGKNKYLSSFYYINCAAGAQNGFVVLNSSAVAADSYKRVGQSWLRYYYLIRDLLIRIKNIVRRHPISYTSQGSNILVSPPKLDGDHAFMYTSTMVPMFTIIDIVHNFISPLPSLNAQLDIVFKIDIEGAEFDALESFLRDIRQSSLFPEINTATFFIEWHERFFDDRDAYAQRKHLIISELKNIFGPHSVHEWV